jgi:hypothetical protein
MPGFNPNTINHELRHYIDGVTRHHRDSIPTTSTMNSAITLMASHGITGLQSQQHQP